MQTKLQKAKYIIQKLRASGFEALIVGGAVRDFVIGVESKDFDIATNAKPFEVEKLFKFTIGVGKQFGVIIVILDNDQFEVATFRKDIDYVDGRRPNKIEFSNAEEDVLRRDFTINGLFWHPETAEIVDFVGGVKDIKAKIVKCIGNPYDRFEEDKLRILRAIRFASTLNFEIEPLTWEAILDRNKFSLSVISKERIRVEFEKILTRGNVFKGLNLIFNANLLEYVIHPEFYNNDSGFTSELQRVFSDNNYSLEIALSFIYLFSTKIFLIDCESKEILVNENFDKKLIIIKEFLKNMTFPIKTCNTVYNILKIILDLLNNKNPDISFLRQKIGHANGMDSLFILKKLELVTNISLNIVKIVDELLNSYTLDKLLPKALITGKDLIELNITPGPLYTNIIKTSYNIQLLNDTITKDEIFLKLKENKLL